MSPTARRLAIVEMEVAEMAAILDRPRPTIRRIAEAVAAEWGTTVEELLTNRRRGQVGVPRHAAMALARALTPHSLPVIGRVLRRDHTSVHHGIRAHEARCLADPALAARCAALINRLKEEAYGEDQARG